MLLPDNIHPEDCIYYTGAMILDEIGKNNGQNFIDLYQKMRKTKKMSCSVFVLSLDWLYLIQAVQVDKDGVIKRCLSKN